MNMQSIYYSRIRFCTWVLIAGLWLSGATAINPDWYLQPFVQWFKTKPASVYGQWINEIYSSLTVTKAQFPFLLYGYDWLAFAHFLIGMLFFGLLKDPVRNKWLVQFGISASLLIIPFAIVFGQVRNIPLVWTIIDCSFTAGAMIPLLVIRKQINIIQNQQNKYSKHGSTATNILAA
jgi:hypothetical protein